MAKGLKKKLKLKDNETDKISKTDIKSNKLTHIKFNFSFITTNKSFCFENPDFVDKHKISLMNRIFELSSCEFINIMNYPKNKGIEFIERNNFNKNVSYKQEFDKVDFRSKESVKKFAVIRLYPNNNPLPTRIIGKLINNIFYVMFIDLNHEMYNG